MNAFINAGGTIIAGVVVALLGYALGVRRSRLERITDRHDTAVAEIFGALMKNERACISWVAGANPEIHQAVRERTTRTS